MRWLGTLTAVGIALAVSQAAVPSNGLTVVVRRPHTGHSNQPIDCQMARAADPVVDPKFETLPPAGVTHAMRVLEVPACGQTLEIGIVDFYGLRRVSTTDARGALLFKEGDAIRLMDGGRPAVFESSEARLAQLPGVVGARVSAVCCDAGRVLVYVGIQERDAPVMRLRPAAQGTSRLPDDILRAGEGFSKAVAAAVERGDAGEDRSQRHALAHDPATRAAQEQFITFARRDVSLLQHVLRDSSDADHRALAAQVLGYVADKQAVVDDLVGGMSDPSDEVRNNAMRAMMVFADVAPGPGGSAPHVPTRPFIEFLHSPVWSDRNKASGALMALSAARDPQVLAEIRQSALAPLVEMARWKSAGHALPAFMILARIAGVTDEAALGSWEQGRREAVIQAAMGVR